MKKLIIAIFCFLTLNINGLARESQAVKINGNSKTRTRHIRKIFENCMVSMKEEEESVDEIRFLNQCLMNARIFSEVDVKRSEVGIWQVKVKERMTLIPVPFFQADSGDDQKMGLIILESNLLGLGKLLATGGSTSKNGNSYFLTFKDKSVSFTKWMASLSVSRTRQHLVLQEMEEKTAAFHESLQAFSGSLGYRFNRLLLAFQTAYLQKSFRSTPGFAKFEEEDREMLKAGVTGKFQASDYKLFFNEGFYSELTFSGGLVRTDGSERTRSVQGKARYGLSILNYCALLTELQGGTLKNGYVSDAFRKGNAKGFRGTGASSLWVRHYGNLALDLQIPLQETRFGTWTWAPFLETGRLAIAGGHRSIISYTTGGIGAYFFLKEIAIPGLGVEFGSNSRFLKKFMSFSVGLSF